jgi:hypothetical protein
VFSLLRSGAFTVRAMLTVIGDWSRLTMGKPARLRVDTVQRSGVWCWAMRFLSIGRGRGVAWWVLNTAAAIPKGDVKVNYLTSMLEQCHGGRAIFGAFGFSVVCTACLCTHVLVRCMAQHMGLRGSGHSPWGSSAATGGGLTGRFTL